MRSPCALLKKIESIGARRVASTLPRPFVYTKKNPAGANKPAAGSLSRIVAPLKIERVSVERELDLAHSAVNVQFDAGDVRRIRGSQESHRRSDFFRLPKPLHRHLAENIARKSFPLFLR